MKLDIFLHVMTPITFVWLCDHIQNRFECIRREQHSCSPATREIVLLTSLHFCVVKCSGIWRPYTVLPQNSMVCIYIWMSKFKMFWLSARTPRLIIFAFVFCMCHTLPLRLQLQEFLLQCGSTHGGMGIGRCRCLSVCPARTGKQWWRGRGESRRRRRKLRCIIPGTATGVLVILYDSTTGSKTNIRRCVLFSLFQGLVVT